MTDLYIDADSEEPLSGGIGHATLSKEECGFIFDLCTAVGWLVINPQGNPITVIPNRNHTIEDLDDSLRENKTEIAWIGNAEELQLVLSEGFSEFLRYKAKVIDCIESGSSQ